MATLPLTHGQVGEVYTALTNLAKRGLPTLDTILKAAELKTKLRPAVDKADGIRVDVAAAADHVVHPSTGQDLVRQPDDLNKQMFEAMQRSAEIEDPDIRFTKADLPKLPDRSDDAEKDKKALAAREDLANDIAGLGLFFTFGG